MSDFINDFLQIKDSAKFAESLRGRAIGSKLGIVSVNEDPQHMRRIKVVFADKPGLDSYWIMRSANSHNLDYPVPKIGQTVRVEFIDGDITKGFYSVLENGVNKPHQTKNELIDYSQIVEGDFHLNVVEEINRGAGKDINDKSLANVNTEADKAITSEAGTTIDLKAGQKITIKAGATTLLTVNANGTITLACALINIESAAINFIGTGGVNGSVDINAANFNLTNVVNAKINGKSIATVSAIDSNGDTLVSKGW